jgi:hypothetical protein
VSYLSESRQSFFPERLPLADVDCPDSPWSAWREQAECRGRNPDTWYPLRGAPGDLALAACAVCPVVTPCLLSGLYEKDGIWGGLTGRQRRVLRRYLRASSNGCAEAENGPAEDHEDADAA